MKYFYYAALLVLLTTFTACKKEMGHDDYTTTDIQGKWILKKQILKQYLNGAIYTDEINTEFNGAFLQFDAGGVGILGNASSQTDFKWNIVGSAVTVSKRLNADQVVGSPYLIKKLNGNEMVLLYEQTEVDYRNNSQYKDVSEEYYTK